MDAAPVRLHASTQAQAAIDAFVEYRRIVGDDDVLMAPDEFEVCGAGKHFTAARTSEIIHCA